MPALFWVYVDPLLKTEILSVENPSSLQKHANEQEVESVFGVLPVASGFAFLGRFDLPGKSRRIFVQVFQWIPVTHIVGSQLLSFGFYMSGGSQVYQLSALDPWLLSVLLWDLGLTHQESASSSFRAFKGALGLPTNRWH